MKELYIFLCLIFISAFGFTQVTPLSNGKNIYSNPVTDFFADINYSNCNSAHANFYYFIDTAGTAMAHWDYGDGFHYDTYSTIVSHDYTVRGTYTVTLTLIYYGDTTIITKPNLITISNPPTVSFNYSTSDTLLFAPLAVSFTNNTMQGDGDSLIYKWDFGDADSSHDANVSHIFLNSGYYHVSLTVTDNVGCKVSYSDNISVKDTAQRGEISYITSQCSNNGTSPCGFEKHYEMKNDTVKVFGYIYENCCGTKTVTIRFTPDTIHIRKFSIGDLCTCGCGFCFAINIPNITQDSIYVDFDGQVKLVTYLMVETRELNVLKGFTLYPSPAIDNITIEAPIKSEIEILNIEGQIVKILNSMETKTTIDLGNLTSGIYIIKAITDKEIVVKKFIKQ